MMSDPIEEIRKQIAELEETKRTCYETMEKAKQDAYETIQELSAKIAALYQQESELMRQRDTSA